MSKNLVLVAESFPPVNNIAAQRFPPMLAVLEAHGWRTWVITQNASGPLSVRLPEERIIRIGQHHQKGMKIREGTISLFPGDSSVRKSVRRTIKALGWNLAAADSSILTWRRLLLRQLDAIQGRLPQQVDVVIGTSRPSAALWFARHLSALYGCPWIADYRDLAALRPAGRPPYVQVFDRFIEGRLLSTAAAATTCGKQWAAELSRRYGIEAHVVYNGWDDTDHFTQDRDDLPALDRKLLPESDPWLYYAGRFGDRQVATVSLLLQAIAGTRFRLVVRSLGPIELEELILRRAEDLGVRGRVLLLEPVPHYVVRAEARSATANLVLETVDPGQEEWTRGHLSGKFLQLLPLEPPLIFVGRRDAEAGEILARTGKGALCTTVEEIREQLRRLEAGRLPTADQAAVFAFSKTRQGEKLLDVIKRARARARAGASSAVGRATGGSLRARS